MINSFWHWFKAVFFLPSTYITNSETTIAILRERLTFETERADRWEAEAKAKTTELHMFVDALLMENGRTPLYATPTALGREMRPDSEPEHKKESDPYDKLRGVRSPRTWANIASSVEEKVAARINGGI